MKITEISIKRPTIVMVLYIILTFGGLLSYTFLNYELLPRFSPPILLVTTVYPGASPGEVETSVTKEIETAVASLENVKKLEAKSYEGVSIVTITFYDDADIDYALNDAQRKINAKLKDLPDEVDPPSLAKLSLDDLPIMTLSASSKLNDPEFFDVVENRLAPALSRIEGVARVDIIGGREREIQVNIDPQKLEGYGLSLMQVQNAILTSNLDFPTGSVKTNKQDILIRLSGKLKNLEELRNLVVFDDPKNFLQIRLKDVADVQDAEKDIEKIARLDQKSTLALSIMKQTDANAVDVSKKVKSTIKTMMDNEYKNIDLNIQVVNDKSDYTLESANAVIFDLILAIILVAVVMIFFLHSIRNSLIVMISIPASLIATFIGMYLMGYSLNLMSLLGLSLVVGILVDDAIVVLENIYRHMEMGKNRVRAAFDGTKEIGFTVTSITLVIVVVFVPIALSSGIAARILKEFCVTVSMATLLSLLASFTLVPWLSSRFGKLERVSTSTIFGRFIHSFERGLNNFTEWISNLLRWCLSHKRITLSIVTVLFFSSFLLVGKGFIGTEFFAAGDRGEFIVQIELPKNFSIEQTNLYTQKAEEYLRKKPEVTRIITTVGKSSEGFFGSLSPAYVSEINVQLIPKEMREEASIYAVKVKKELSNILVGAKVKTTPISIMGTAERAPIALVVFGSDLDSVMSYANTAMDELKKINGATEIKLSVEAGNPEVKVEIDRDKMSILGLNMITVGSTMRTAFSGNNSAKFRTGEYEYDINIRYGSFNRQNIEDVQNLMFTNNRGEKILLSQFAEVKEGSGPSMLERRDKSTSVTIEAQSVGRPSGDVASEWGNVINELRRPAGVNFLWSGNIEMQQDGFGTLGIALIAAILLVYLILVALYDSFVYPLVVLFSIPLAVIGALLALALSNNTLNLFTILGLIMLIGLVAKNAIILVDFTNQRKKEGSSTFQALLDANRARLRPILMTTLAMVFGMLPIAMASGAGAEWKNGLAWVIIGGLVSSLFLTLIVVPVMYDIFDKIILKFNRGKAKPSIEKLMKEQSEVKLPTFEEIA
ncbi:MAG: efflux RND transporter permease subunit [Bacteroidota bacterium]